ncbi:hypothetical protein AGMMS4957_17530 [Bacteroidia bacterium]|nr:hypothetical protein AGMMS4957_17530 [Bacteroidia bacterium]
MTGTAISGKTFANSKKMEATINRNYAEVSSGDDLGLDGIRSGWNGFLQRCEDYWDLFTIWLHRNQPTMPLREFMAEVDEMNKADVRSFIP